MKQDTLEGKAKTKNGVKRLCFSIICILLEVVFIITIVTRLNEYAEIINLFTRILSGILVLRLYASDKTSSMKMPWVILILIFPIMGVGLYLLIGLNGGTHKMRVYEWTPGFCHAKMSVVDDCMATCGTINLDYRSLYHHFENGCFMIDCQSVLDIKSDLIKTMGECRDVTEQYCTGRSAYLRLGQLFMRLFAGLL